MQQQNIDNLTSLWLLAAQPFNAYKKSGSFNIIELDFSEWPNRVWQDTAYSEKGKIKDILQQTSIQLTFSKWNALEIDEQQEAIDLGLNLKSIQIGMSLLLQRYDIQPADKNLMLKKVSNSDDAAVWSEVFHQCFGYSIPYTVVAAIMGDVSFSLLTRDSDTVGCVAIFIKDNQIGIHSLGILNEFRKQGLAEIVMHNILGEAKIKGLEMAHLQSSMLGLGIYRKIGFEEIFKMCNYKI